MIHFYIDESGTSQSKQPGKRPEEDFFVLSAVSLAATDCPLAEREVLQLKRNWISAFEPEEFEIKGRYLRQGDDVYSGWDWAARLQAFHDVAELMARLPCQIYTVLINRAKLETRRTHQELYGIAFRHLLEHLGRGLAEQNELGMLFVDTRTDAENKQLVQVYRAWEKQQDQQGRFLGTPWFGRSEFYAGIQLADVAAYLANIAAMESYAQEREPDDTDKPRRRPPLVDAYQRFAEKVTLLPLPDKKEGHGVP
ncbi:MAG: DUF3800 domain-containing protein [Acidobacteria bacterium]|nr:DUF3800 domain-containing protein [Acidobacteriota bacterium]